MARVAFIGLGNMGGGMAANLAKAGHDVRAFRPERAGAGQGGGARVPARRFGGEAVQDVDAVVSMLPAGSMCARSMKQRASAPLRPRPC
jgi:3-hydroxyisobutyrate dehydrogenase